MTEQEAIILAVRTFPGARVIVPLRDTDGALGGDGGPCERCNHRAHLSDNHGRYWHDTCRNGPDAFLSSQMF